MTPSGGQPPGPYDQLVRSRAIDVRPQLVTFSQQYDSAVSCYERKHRHIEGVRTGIRATRVALTSLHVALDELVDVDPNSSEASSLGKLVLDSAKRLEQRLSRLGPFDDPNIIKARRAAFEIRNLLIHGMTRYTHEAAPPARPARPGRRTRCATGLAVRLLPPADRDRYREEFAAELADLPRADQAPYAIRLVFRAWSLRCSLTGRSSHRPVSVVVVVAVGADCLAWLAGIDWPAAVLGGVVVIALMWTVSNQDRTRRLATLIRAARGGRAPTRKR